GAHGPHRSPAAPGHSAGEREPPTVRPGPVARRSRERPRARRRRGRRSVPARDRAAGALRARAGAYRQPADVARGGLGAPARRSNPDANRRHARGEAPPEARLVGGRSPPDGPRRRLPLHLMRRVRIRFALLAVALLVPLALLVDRVVRSLDLERRMRHQVVAERVFDEMERALSEVLDAEEGRSSEKWLDVDAPALPFVVDRFQIDPDGSVRAARGSGDALTRIVGPFFRQAAVAQDKAEAEPQQRAGSTMTVEELDGKVRAPAVAAEAAKSAPSA